MTIHLDDRRLRDRVLNGDAAAFDSFFSEYYARLYRFALPRVSGDETAAEEIAQEALTRGVRHLHTYRGESQLFTWLCTICRNVLADWQRRQARYRETIVLAEDDPALRAAIDSLPAADAFDPVLDYERGESHRLIQVALDSLPARYGDALEWKYIEGHSVSDIAGRLEIGREATQSLLARARRAFAAAYRELFTKADAHRSEG